MIDAKQQQNMTKELLGYIYLLHIDSVCLTVRTKTEKQLMKESLWRWTIDIIKFGDLWPWEVIFVLWDKKTADNLKITRQIWDFDEISQE